MRILTITAALLLATAVAASATTKPHVSVGLAPLVVAGSGFPHAAPVRILVSAGNLRLSKSMRTTRAGAFRAVWTRPLGGSCTGIFVSASSGTTRATWRSALPKSCPPPAQP
jgi:hypothetical protein